MAALALLAAGLGWGLHTMNQRARVASAQMHELQAQTSAVEEERKVNAARMMEPRNHAVLERTQFLNQLFASKSFSWTSVMMDLENVLPAGVQVTSIEPVINPDGGVNIHLHVSGPRDLQVDLVRNLERSQRFLAPHVANETAQSEEEGRLMSTSGAGVPGGVQFDIVSGYNPLPAAAKGQARKEVAGNEPANEGRPAASGAKVIHKAAGTAGSGRASTPLNGSKAAVKGGAR
jgi:type IV pilus assembly protein PilN